MCWFSILIDCFVLIVKKMYLGVMFVVDIGKFCLGMVKFNEVGYDVIIFVVVVIINYDLFVRSCVFFVLMNIL